MSGRAVLACSSVIHDSHWLKLGSFALVRSHQCAPPSWLTSSHQPASWSATSLKTRLKVLPQGFDATPAELRNAATKSASWAGLTAALVLVAMSTPLAQDDAWVASSTLGADLSRRWRSAPAKPWTVSSRPATSAYPKLFTLAESAAAHQH